MQQRNALTPKQARAAWRLASGRTRAETARRSTLEDHVSHALKCGLLLAMLSGPLAADECTDLRHRLDELIWAETIDTMVGAAQRLSDALSATLTERSKYPPNRVTRQLDAAAEAFANVRAQVRELVEEIGRMETGQEMLFHHALALFRKTEIAAGELYFFTLCISHREGTS